MTLPKVHHMDRRQERRGCRLTRDRLSDQRIGVTVSGGGTSWTEPGLEPGFDGAPPDEIVAAFAEVRAETVATILILDDAGWARSGTHATYGMLDVAGLMRIAVDHDREHLEGIARAG